MAAGIRDEFLRIVWVALTVNSPKAFKEWQPPLGKASKDDRV
jgi:hypothetical protein